MSSIDIVIVNWNVGSQLRECLSSIRQSAGSVGLLNKVVIVDNASTDDSLLGLDGLDLPMILIQNDQNRGFAVACNQGARASSADYVLFLNPDCRLFSDSLIEPFRFMENPMNSKVGVVGVQLINEKGYVSRTCARFPTLFGFVARSLGLDILLPGAIRGFAMNEWNHLDSRPVDQVIGAFYFVRRRVFESLGGFDEQFFVYMEELDFSLRARNAGWSTYYLAEATAFHKGGGASEQVKAQRLFYSIRSRILYSYKHFSRPAAFFLLITTLFVEPVSRLVLALSRRSGDMALETLQGFALLWRDLPNILRTVILSGR